MGFRKLPLGCWKKHYVGVGHSLLVCLAEWIISQEVWELLWFFLSIFEANLMPVKIAWVMSKYRKGAEAVAWLMSCVWLLRSLYGAAHTGGFLGKMWQVSRMTFLINLVCHSALANDEAPVLNRSVFDKFMGQIGHFVHGMQRGN